MSAPWKRRTISGIAESGGTKGLEFFRAFDGGGGKVTTMALTRDFKETIRARVKRDPGFRKALLREGIENFLSGDVETGKIILRDFINATVGFTKLSDATHRSAKSLMRMLGPRGNPQARNLFEIVAYLQHAEGVRFEVRSTRATIRTKKRPSPQAAKRIASAVLSH
jgi:DNA-binding phage protein